MQVIYTGLSKGEKLEEELIDTKILNNFDDKIFEIEIVNSEHNFELDIERHLKPSLNNYNRGYSIKIIEKYCNDFKFD